MGEPVRRGTCDPLREISMTKLATRRRALLCLAASASAVALAGPVAAATPKPGEPLPHGYGRCSLCACPGYTGNQWVCDNCGHNYQAHW
jgi:hypothetical protein